MKRDFPALESATIAAIGGFASILSGSAFMQAFEGFEGAMVGFAVIGAFFYVGPWAALMGAGGLLIDWLHERGSTSVIATLSGAMAAGLTSIAANGAAYALGVESGATWACAALALILSWVWVRFLPDLLGSSAALVATIPGLALALAIFAVTADAFALWASIRNSFLDPNAVLIAALAGIGLLAGLASSLIYLRSERRAVLALAAIIGGCGIILSYLNRFVLTPRLYLEAHMALAVFEWLFFAGALAPVVRRVSKPRPGIAVVVCLIGGLLAMQVYEGRTPRRVDHSAEAFAEPWRGFADWDEDGYFAEHFGGVDCNDSEAAINPFERDIPSDGIDQNCLGGDYTPVTSPRLARIHEREPSDLIILVSIDMLRPDKMSVYGYEEPTTPFLDETRDEWIRFDRAYATGGITTLSLPSLTRALIPLALNFEPVYRTTDYRYVFEEERAGERVNRVFPSVRGDQHPTIAERFVNAAAFVDDGPSGVFQRGLGYEDGFELFSYPNPPDGPGYPEWGYDDVTDALLDYLKDAPAQSFVWAHYYDPHNAPGPCERFDPIPGVVCYLDAIHDIDGELRRIRNALQEAGRWENSTLLMTSDHGEAFGEHRLSHHGTDGYEEFIRIPMLVKPSRGLMAGKTIQTPVSLVDASTTALAAARIDVSGEIRGTHGRDLLAIATSEEREPVLSQGLLLTLDGRAYRQHNVMVRGDERVMFDRASRRTWAYDLSEDPLQTTQRAPTAEQLEALFDMIDAYEADSEPAPRKKIP